MPKITTNLVEALIKIEEPMIAKKLIRMKF